jgi:hypothetical protein
MPYLLYYSEVTYPHPYQPINVPTARAQALLMDYTHKENGP